MCMLVVCLKRKGEEREEEEEEEEEEARRMCRVPSRCVSAACRVARREEK